MGASSSRSSSAAKQYDVFISFRGEDTRYNFISHLYSALSRYSIRAFIDHELNKGDEISPALIQAIQDSYGSLVVFSENYASSKWCLNELLEICECRKQGCFLIPVFYKIDPSHIRKQTGSYATAFAKHEQDSNNSKEKLHKWKVALSETANIVGWDSESRIRDESELIQNIVEDILEKLDHIHQPSELGLVGIEKRCGHIESLLQNFPVVGIWGMGGIGKTTIARVAFDKLFSQYDSCCFLENVREESLRSGLNQLCDKLLSKLLKEDIIPIHSHKATRLKYAMRRLRNKKVFIVLDDVNSSKQLEHLEQECNFLGPDSRVIITTRDRHLLTSLKVPHEIYEVERLDFEESLWLFRSNAFNKNYLEIGYEELSKEFINYAKGTPLALKVLGSFLRSKSREEWKSTLRKLNKIPNEDIHMVLKLSFEGLNHEEQQIFLEIACFLKGEKKEKVIDLLESYGLYGVIGLRTLQDRALITISYEHKVQMHDLIQEMGREIIRKESIEEPERRSRLWDVEEVYDVLKYNKGTEAILGIILDMSQIRDLYLSGDTFKKMTNLRFLQFYYGGHGKPCKVHLCGDIHSLSNKLRYLYWDRCPLHSLPSTFSAEKLVEFHMPHSHIKKLWNGVQDLGNLKRINLRGSENLIELPDFSKASSLKWVDLAWCTSLSHIHPSILSLQTLERLDLLWCRELRSLQSEVHLKSLKYVNILFCSSLKEFSLISEEIRDLKIEDTAIETLHSSIGHCSNLANLSLSDSLKNLSSQLSNLKSLQSLRVTSCRELDTPNLHMALDGLQQLRELLLSDCCKLSKLPDNIKHLSYLKGLRIENCRRLSCIPELPPSIKTLSATNCTSLETVITSTALEHLPSFYTLTNCVKLDESSSSAIIEVANFIIKQTALWEVNSVGFYRIIFPGNRVPSFFRYRTTQNRITIEIPPRSHLTGLAFCCVLSPEFLPDHDKYIYCRECHCLVEHRRRIQTSRIYVDLKLISDHVIIWDDLSSYEIQNSIIICRDVGKMLSFEFYAKVSSSLTTIGSNHVIKECGVWPMYAFDSEYDNSINDIEQNSGSELDFRADDIDEEEQFFAPTSDNITQSLLPMEIQSDESGPSTTGTGTGIASCVLDHQDQDEQEPFLQTKELKEFIFKLLPTDISMQNIARQHLPKINSSCPLNRTQDNDHQDEDISTQNARFSKLDYSTIQTELNLDLALGNKSKRCRDTDDNQQIRRKKLNRFQDMDVLLRGASTSRIGVGCSEFDCVNHFELQPLTHTNTMKELAFQLLPIDSSMQNECLDLMQMNSTCLLDRFSELDNRIKECGVCPVNASEYHSSKDQMGLNLELELALGNKSKRCRYELEADEQQQIPLTKKLKESSLQLVPLGLELELNSKSKRGLENDGIQVGGSSRENQHEQEKFLTNKGIEGIYLPSTSNWNPEAE